MVSLVTWEAMPQPLPSPTLTNPDMILPDLDQSLDTAASTPLHTPRPLSPRSHLLKQGFRLDNPPLGRRGASSRASVASSTYSRHLDDDASGDGETTPKSLNPQGGNALAHEQRLNGAPRIDVMGNWQQDMNRKSSASSSMRSNDVDALPWAGFDSSQDDDDDDDAVSLADSEWRHRLSYISTVDDTDNEQWSSGDDEASNSAALSRRAEAILAHAKKRLNLMEGNLRGARQSLMPPSTVAYSTYRSNSAMASQPYAARDGGGPRYFGLSHLPPRQRSFRSAPRNSSGNSGHSRGYSEINVPENLAQAQPIKEKRAASALGSMRGRWTPPSDNSSDARAAALRGTRSHEVMRTGWGASDHNPLRSGHESSLPSPSLETLREVEDTHPGELRRSASTTNDLRAHMNDLKGRISSLKDRAREDRMKRTSMQDLRTPSPFTASELWYSGADAYKQHASTNGGVQFRNHEAFERGNDEISMQSSPISPGFPRQEQTPPDSYQGSHYEDAEDSVGEERANVSQEHEDDAEELDDSAEFEDGESEREIDADSLYDNDQEFHDAQVTTERHEDRADAFDYEHFFLHSAMGTYRQRASSASSASSEGSVETTRAISPVQPSDNLRGPESPKSSHRRTKSQESISTLATFATATESFGSGSDDGSDNEALDSFTRQAFSPALLDPKSAVGKQNLTDSGYGQSLLSPTPSIESLQEYHNDPAARIMAGFFTPNKARGRLTPLSQKDEDLLYALTTSIQQVVSRLQNTTEAEDEYETRIWRRRLDQARKILDGVPSEEV
ncbi:hypothetical protein K490DRAFT_55460 [Saccharata proteae CBS 121410]|uniref:Uncharacterized protein n=1 Tax=Saccharata proteae CBS 121410 TaxID=1314787 RepID=A0A6A5YBY8_9PEZI|nr:hypothetical protein K490DRAFT_55460 [Saccharata proteae CBS 121410]